jgi:dipeptidyl aminopeptidase/acylaminoacyl peptidase
MKSQKHFPTIDEMIELPEPGDAQISPDGRFIAYTVTQPDWKQNEMVPQIWMVTVQEGQERQMTFGTGSSSQPRWSLDGKWLTYFHKGSQDKVAQIYRMAPDGGGAEKLTAVEGEILAHHWSPDGNTVAFIMSGPEDEKDKQRKEKYGDYRVDNVDYQRARIWVYDLKSKNSRSLTGKDQYHVSEIDWSPDSRQIAFIGKPSPDMNDDEKGCVYLLNLADLQVKALTGEGYSVPRWSPDGRHIACNRVTADGYAGNIEIDVLDVDSGVGQSITDDFDEWAMLLDWGVDGIYFNAFQRTSIHLFRIDPVDKRINRLTADDPPGWVSMETSFSAGFKLASFVGQDKEHYSEVILLDLPDGQPKRLTHFTDVIEDWQLGEKEIFQWQSQDGTPIEGILTRPDDFDPQRKYPLLVVIHGGPTWISLLTRLTGSARRFYPLVQWLEKGALILEPNYRGSAGYGEDFRKLNMRNLGTGDYWDVISGVDALIERGWVDADRVASMGWSQGGYISAFLTTYSDRFKAVSVGAGISDWMTYYVNTDIHPFTRQYLKATPWEDEEIYRKTSPITYIQQARTPTLIQHGERDQRVPLPNAFELYQGLIDQGVEAKLIVYAGMGHGPNKPKQMRQIMQSNFDWFNRWIWNEKTRGEEEKIAYVAIASGKKSKLPENLPAVERYQGAWVQDVYLWARRDQVLFYIFSGEFGLVEENFPTPPDDHVLMPEDVSAIAIRTTELLKDENIRRLVLFTPDAKDNPWVYIYLGCLQVAAGLAGEISIEHRQVKDEGW